MLTAKSLAALSRDGRFAAGQVPGLYVQIRNGNKTWVFDYSLFGKRRLMGLGPVAETSLSDAREKALELRRMVRQGVDPIASRDADLEQRRLEQQRRIAFKACAEQFFSIHSGAWTASHALQWMNSLRDHAFPTIGAIPVADLTRADVLRCLAPVWETKMVTMDRVRGRIEEVCDMAIANGWRVAANPATWSGNLEHSLASKSKKVRRVEHHASLSYGEIGALCAELRLLTSSAAACLELIILTASRTNEIRQLRWSEVDLANRCITIDAARMKARVAHRIPLSPRAMEILSARSHLSAPFADVGRDAVADLSKKLRPAVSVHGYRATFKSWSQDTTGVAREVAELCLAHQVGNATELAYSRTDLLARRAALMADWAAWCAVPAQGKVVPLRGTTAQA